MKGTSGTDRKEIRLESREETAFKFTEKVTITFVFMLNTTRFEEVVRMSFATVLFFHDALQFVLM